MAATTKAKIRNLVDRLCMLPAQDQTIFGIDPQLIRDELGRAIERHAKSDEEAAAIVDRLMEGKFRPLPSDIRDAAENLHAPPKWEAAKGCPFKLCDGSGWVATVIGGHEGVWQCKCRAGAAA